MQHKSSRKTWLDRGITCHAGSEETDCDLVIVRQVPLSVGFYRQEYWSGLPCPPPGDLPNPGIKPTSLTSPALAGRFLTTSTTWEAHLAWGTLILAMFSHCIFQLIALKTLVAENLTCFLQFALKGETKLTLLQKPLHCRGDMLYWKNNNNNKLKVDINDHIPSKDIGWNYFHAFRIENIILDLWNGYSGWVSCV